MNKPTANFDGPLLCAGKVLQLALTGTPPFKVEYTYNGTATSVSGITKSPYILATLSGKYQLLAVSSNGCSNRSLTGILTTEIAPSFTPLRIRRE